MNKVFSLFILISFLSPTLGYTQNYIVPVKDDFITVDGLDHEWYSLQHYSAEYHQSGPLSSRMDLKARTSITLSNHHLFLLTCMLDDQNLVEDQLVDIKTDQILVLLKTKRKNIELHLQLNPQIKKDQWLKTRGITKQAVMWKMKSSIKDHYYQHCVEWKVSLQAIPKLYGSSMKFSTLFVDVDFVDVKSPDKEQEISTYATHVVNKGKNRSFTPKVKFFMGGNLVSKKLYEMTNRRKLRSLKKIKKHWVGDKETEEIYITAQDVVVFGRDLPCGGSCEWVHGWSSDARITEAFIKTYPNAKHNQLHIIHKEPFSNSTQIKWIYVHDILEISTHEIERKFSHIIQIDTTEGSFKTEWKMSRQGRYISIQPIIVDQIPDFIDQLTHESHIYPLILKETTSAAIRYDLN